MNLSDKEEKINVEDMKIHEDEFKDEIDKDGLVVYYRGKDVEKHIRNARKRLKQILGGECDSEVNHVFKEEFGEKFVNVAKEVK